MALFDFYGKDELRGKCETRHFRIDIIGDIEKDKDVFDFEPSEKGTFMHEYVHYIQHITTLFGLKYNIVYNNLFSICHAYFIENENIEIPIDIKKINTIAKKFLIINYKFIIL